MSEEDRTLWDCGTQGNDVVFQTDGSQGAGDRSRRFAQQTPQNNDGTGPLRTLLVGLYSRYAGDRVKDRKRSKNRREKVVACS